MKTTSRKTAYLIVLLAVIVIVAVWWANGAELEDAWLYLAGIGIVLTGIPMTQPKKDRANE